jgi:hypothetical protein
MPSGLRLAEPRAQREECHDQIPKPDRVTALPMRSDQRLGLKAFVSSYVLSSFRTMPQYNYFISGKFLMSNAKQNPPGL